ncbi:hypothetical protein [Thioclava kandeliae]|uniref:Uncharacterized protein n=1 Tax=Thioclava kandeliae TaxID=3070818 RepID=A0ABV1SDK1_9RHOB
MIVRLAVMILVLASATGARAQGDRTQQLVGCLDVLSAYSSWLEHVEAMRMPGISSGFYGNTAREMARIDNGRYLLLTDLSRSQSREQMAIYFDTLATPRDGGWILLAPEDFAAVGQDMRHRVTLCGAIFLREQREAALAR